jgi:hypothetical protein
MEDSMEHTVRAGRLSSTRKHLSASRESDVDAIEKAMSRFTEAHPLASDCEVAFFQVANDRKLHVNVTHRRATEQIRGWAGPGDTPDGFVYNRTFGGVPTTQIARRVREMVFADPV